MNDGREQQSQRAGNGDGYRVDHGRFESNVKKGNEEYTVFPSVGEKKWTVLSKKRSVGSIQDMACMGGVPMTG